MKKFYEEGLSKEEIEVVIGAQYVASTIEIDFNGTGVIRKGLDDFADIVLEKYLSGDSEPFVVAKDKPVSLNNTILSLLFESMEVTITAAVWTKGIAVEYDFDYDHLYGSNGYNVVYSYDFKTKKIERSR